MSAFVSLPGNGTARRIILLSPQTNEELKAELLAPFAVAASEAADVAFLAAAFTPISIEDAKEYLRSEHHRAIAKAVDTFRRDWLFAEPNFENELINVVAHAFYWRINELARSPGLGGCA
jgi:hypothetical protein